MTCKTCKFWVSDDVVLNKIGNVIPAGHKDANPSGECRAKPPSPIRGQSAVWRAFPRTIDDDWCWEHVAKPEAPPPPPPPPVEVKNTPLTAIPQSTKGFRVRQPRKGLTDPR